MNGPLQVDYQNGWTPQGEASDPKPVSRPELEMGVLIEVALYSSLSTNGVYPLE